jgi:geranylgeranyl diphosphate synthase, type II
MSKTTCSSFADLVQLLGPHIDAALHARTQLGEGCPDRLREAMRYSLLAPGKRIRPMLVLLAAKACGGNIEAALPAACAVEMVHAYSLIHDDLPALDNDDLRRGRPTCHKAFDEATAILAGDALLTLAFKVLAAEIAPSSTAALCCAALAEAAGACNMVGGQVDDLAAEKGMDASGVMNEACAARAHVIANAQNASVKAYTIDQSGEWNRIPMPESEMTYAFLHAIHSRKTGAMIRVSLRLGAMVAGASDEKRAALRMYGDELGLAFQITDDLLDVQSSEAAMGKRVGKDAARGKLTFPGLLGLDQSRQHAEQSVLAACKALEEPFGEEAEGLRTLARYVLERNR